MCWSNDQITTMEFSYFCVQAVEEVYELPNSAVSSFG